MRKLWRKLLEPWREFPGWEFDLLRSLPSAVARTLYLRACIRARPKLLKDWRWPAVIVLTALASMSIMLVWAAAVLLGLGVFGRIVLEVAFHATLGIVIIHPLTRLQNRIMLPHVRCALVDELLDYARDELAPPPRPRSMSKKN